jgi:hypothetical protein
MTLRPHPPPARSNSAFASCGHAAALALGSDVPIGVSPAVAVGTRISSRAPAQTGTLILATRNSVNVKYVTHCVGKEARLTAPTYLLGRKQSSQ